LEFYLTFAIIGVGIFLFVREVFRIDTTSILIMAMFIVSGVLSPEEGFSGFNHPATITLGCMFVVSAGIFKSGIIDGLALSVIRLAKLQPNLALILLCSVTVVLSAFINDSAVVAVMIPVGLNVCRQTGISPSKIMMPLSFAALFGGTCTLIGTSTNILVSSFAAKSGLGNFGMFEFSLPALCLLVVGMAYLFIVGPWMLPKRISTEKQIIRDSEKYICEVELLSGNKDIHQNIIKSRLTTSYNANILSITRDKMNLQPFDRHTVLREGDVIKIMITPDQLALLRAEKHNRIKGENQTLDLGNSASVRLSELFIPTGSTLSGKTLKEENFRNVYSASVIAIRHRDETITQNLSDLRLREGDMVLVYGKNEDIDRIVEDKLMVVVSDYNHQPINYRKAIPAMLIAIGVVITATLGIAPILISGMIGALLLVTTSILSPREAYEAIEWKVIFMVAGVLSMGTALEKTGGAEMISNLIFKSFGSFSPNITLSLIFLTTLLSTNILSSKATVALMSPIVITLAAQMNVSYKPLLIAVMFACSLTFMTPMSYTTNTMVYAAGNYRFMDYIKFGTPLNLLIWLVASFVIPWFFPF